MEHYIEDLLQELPQAQCQLFDVREQKEWNQGFVENAVLQPLSVLKQGKLLHEADKKKKTYLYCTAGVRVLSANELLKAMGFYNVIPLAEGIMELKSLGFCIQKDVL